jgi:Tol biopolymer transport system component
VRGEWLLGIAIVAGSCGEPTASLDAPTDAAVSDGFVGVDGEASDDAIPDVPDAALDAPPGACAVDAPIGMNVTIVATDATHALRSYRLSRDARTLVLLGDLEVDNMFYLYAVRVDGGPLVRLSHAYGYGELVLDFRITDDGQNVVFIADPGALGQRRLYRAPIGGGTIVPLYEGPDQVHRITLPPAGDRVLFQTGSPPVLRSIPLTGGADVTLSHGTEIYDTIELVLTPDGGNVIYREFDPVAVQTKLYLVPIAGGTIRELAPGVTPGLYETHFTPDGAHLTFYGQTDSETLSIYDVSVADGVAYPIFSQPIHGSLPPYALSRDGASIAVISDYEVPDLHRLYVVPRAGGTPLRLSQNTLDDDRLDVTQLAFSADGSRIAFAGDPEWPDVYRIYSVASAGGAIVTLSPNLGVTNDLDAYGMQIAADGRTVVFEGDPVAPDVPGIYSAPIEGGALATLSPSQASFGARLSARDVLFRANAGASGPSRLYRTGFDGIGPEVLSIDPGSDPDHDVQDVEPTADGCWVVYGGPLETTGVYGLYARKIR